MMHTCKNKRQKKGVKRLDLNSTRSSAFRTQFPNLRPLFFKKICTQLLRKGHKVKFEAPGRSMHPTIRHGDIIIVEPISPTAVRVDDIVLYQNKLGVVAHRVMEIIKRKDPQTPPLMGCCANVADRKAPLPCSDPYSIITPQGMHTCSCRQAQTESSTSQTLKFLLRGDAARIHDEPVNAEQILGKVLFVERNGRRIDPYTFRANLFLKTRRLAAALKRFALF